MWEEENYEGWRPDHASVNQELPAGLLRAFSEQTEAELIGSVQMLSFIIDTMKLTDGLPREHHRMALRERLLDFAEEQTDEPAALMMMVKWMWGWLQERVELDGVSCCPGHMAVEALIAAERVLRVKMSGRTN